MNVDVLVGISAGKLNQSIGQVFNNPGLKSRLFAGSQAGAYSGVPYSVSFSLQQAPVITFREPTAQEWAKAITTGGSVLAKVQSAFIVELPNLALNIKAGDDINTSAKVTAICNIRNRGASIDLRAIGVVNNFDKASDFDRFLIQSVLVPNVLTMVNKSLSGIAIPAPSLPGVSLTAPFADVQGNYLLLAYNTIQDGVPNLQGVALPSDPFFILASRQIVQLMTNYVMAKEVRGKTFRKHDSDGAAGFSGEYTAIGRINGISARVSNDPTRFQADVSLSMTASAGFSTPIGVAVKEVEKAGKTVVKALDPTGW